MVRLIATDMDGTLLDSQKQLPGNLDYVLSACKEKGVRFAIASGRQYANVLHQFPAWKDELIFLSENGTMAFEKGVPLFLHEMPREDYLSIASEAEKVKGASPILCGVRRAYALNGDAQFMKNVEMYYKEYEIVDDLRNVSDQICKVAVFDANGAEYNSYPFLSRLKTRFDITLSGELWVDIMPKGISKGSGIKELRERLGVDFTETMVFGDYLNDLTLMTGGFYSYAMANAHPELKRAARFEAPSNDENGVVRVIRDALQIPFTPDIREIPYGGEAYEAELSLRNEVLRKPLGFDLRKEDLSKERGFCHIGAFDGNFLVGCMVLKPLEFPPLSSARPVRMMQVAVNSQYRGQGIGREMEGFAQVLARERGYTVIRLHARKTAQGFYEKLHYKGTGPAYNELGIPHIPMEKELF